MTSAAWRLFVGLRLPPPLHTALLQAQRLLREQALAVRWTAAANLHITLHFLGDVAAAQVPMLETALGVAVASQQAPLIQFSRLGAFPDAQQPRVVWAGLAQPDPALLALHQACGNALSALGHELETRPYHPHATLGYVRRDATAAAQQAIGAALTLPWPGSAAHHTPQVALFRSELRPAGSVYTPLATWELPAPAVS